MKAIFATGGKQYLVNEGSELYIEKTDIEPKGEITFDTVLYVDGKVGNPYVKGAKVIAEVIKSGLGKKVIIFKYNAKKRYRNKQGHRQPYTKIVIKKIEVK